VRKHPLGSLRRGWEDNIKMDVNGVCFKCGRWMELAQDFVPSHALILVMLNLCVLQSVS
jgi:hypothetical protein